MFRIKICGITRPVDARIVALAGADAMGLNFFPESSRYVDLPTAAKIVADLRGPVAKVGVFVNCRIEEVQLTADQLELDWIQLHGDEPPELLGKLAGRQVLKAFRVGPDGLQPVAAYLDECQRLGRLPNAVLIDGLQEGQYGGTGVTTDWQALSAHRELLRGLPVVLAGGLTPFNVTEAIAATRPNAVDTASGVESKAGLKDPMLVRAFVNSSRKAFQEMGADAPEGPPT